MTDYDPYDMNNYYTPGRGKVEAKQQDKKAFNPYETQNKKVFNPYETQKPEEEFPEYVDLTKNAYQQKQATTSNPDTDEEIPLLEGKHIKIELGICPENIKHKFISVLTYNKIDKKILEDADMTGPLLIFILFALALALVICVNLAK
jgi:hypothetical protein